MASGAGAGMMRAMANGEPALRERIGERLAALHERIAAACQRGGRDPGEVRVLAVSKKQPPEVIEAAADCGLRVFGENRVQEAAAKIPLCPEGLHWHLIGHLQTNKVKPAVYSFAMIHSVDSIDLLERIDRHAAEAGRTMPVLMQVNVAGESAKFGISPEAAPALLEASTRCMNVDLLGLMTLPPFTPDPADAAPVFQRLRELRDQWRRETGIPLGELSMGMSHDFEYAIEAGATWIRLGTLLLGERGR